MKYFVIAGERSGDLHAGNLMKALKSEDSSADFRYWGGDYMQAVAGNPPTVHYNEMAFLGYYEVLVNIRKVLNNIDYCKKDLVDYQPDVLILIDYPSFNLKIAEFAKKQGIKVFYYISPKVWVWKEKRVFKIKKWVDKMFVIFPFEVDFYKKFDYDSFYTGNPLLDEISDYTPSTDFIQKNNLSDKPIIGVLPGSRKQEVTGFLQDMLTIVKEYPDHQFVIGGVNNLSSSFYEPFIDNEQISVVYEQTYDLLSHSKVALVASGTATLETALFNIPQVVCYRLNKISAFIVKLFIKVKYVSLVNLIGNREIVTELLQENFNPTRMKEELDKLLFDKEYLQKMLAGYDELHDKMGEKGASIRTAREMIKCLKE